MKNRNKKAQEESTLVWIVAIFIIIFILLIYFFAALAISETKSFNFQTYFGKQETSFSDVSSSKNFLSFLESEIDFRGEKQKVVSAVFDSFEDYFEVKNKNGESLVEKYGLDNYYDVSRVSKDNKIKDGFDSDALDRIDESNLELAEDIKAVLDNYCRKYRVAVPQGMITESGLKSSDALGSRLYFVMGWGDPIRGWSPAVGFNFSYRGFKTSLEFTYLKECSGFGSLEEVES